VVFSFKGRVVIVDFALQSGEIPYYRMEIKTVLSYIVNIYIN